MDVSLTGFETAEIDLLIESLSGDDAALGADEFMPAMSAGPLVTRPGDLWLLGDHRLLCGDARAPLICDQLMDGEKAQMVFTDPPYNVSIPGHVSGLGRIRHGDFAMACGEMSEAEFTAFLTTIFSNLSDHSADGSIHYVCMDWRQMAEILSAGKAAYAELKNVCVWVKNNGGMGAFYRSKHELIFVFKNGSAPHINNFELGQLGRTRTNVWEYAGVNTFGLAGKKSCRCTPQ